MRISIEEQAAIQRVLNAGENFGYRNMILHLQTAWAKALMDQYGFDEKYARQATGGDGFPFDMQTDLAEGGYWDETGAKYTIKEPYHDFRIQTQNP